MKASIIKDFLNIKDVSDTLIDNAIIEAKNFMIRKHVFSKDDPLDLTIEGDLFSAWKYLTVYFLLPQLSMVVGEMGASKQIGHGDSVQQLISEADIEKKQKFYYNHAISIITDILNSELPFGIDV